jgi:hypothetical protein
MRGKRRFRGAKFGLFIPDERDIRNWRTVTMSEILTPYTVAEVAALTGFSERTITKMFEGEPGVLIYEVPRKRKRASYRTIRIPRPVYQRVIRRITIA